MNYHDFCLKLRWFGIDYCHLLLRYCGIDIVALPSVFHYILTSLMSARRCCVGNFTATQFEHLLDVLARPEESRRAQLQLLSMSWPKPIAVSTLLVISPINCTIISAADWDLAPGPLLGSCDALGWRFLLFLSTFVFTHVGWIHLSLHTVGVYTVIMGLFLLSFLVPMLYSLIASFRSVFKLVNNYSLLVKPVK